MMQPFLMNSKNEKTIKSLIEDVAQQHKPESDLPISAKGESQSSNSEVSQTSQSITDFPQTDPSAFKRENSYAHPGSK